MDIKLITPVREINGCHSRVAQLVERRSVKADVAGSYPALRAMKNKLLIAALSLFLLAGTANADCPPVTRCLTTISVAWWGYIPYLVSTVECQEYYPLSDPQGVCPDQ